MNGALRAASLSLTLALAATSGLPAQGKGNLNDRITAAAEESSIDTEGLRPWHLKLDVQRLDPKGEIIEQGTIEEWWSALNLHKTTYTFPSFTGTELHNQQGTFRTTGKELPPLALNDLLDHAVHPINLTDLATRKPTLRQKTIGTVAMDCIMLDDPKVDDNPPLGLFPTYCFDQGKNSLRTSNALGTLSFIRNSVGHFQQKSVALDIIETDHGIIVAKGHVTALSSITPQDDTFLRTPNMEPQDPAPTKVGSDLVKGAILTKTQPIYPQSAKKDHIEGDVILAAIIGRDGRVRSLKIVSSNNEALSSAALIAVRNWTYAPYLLHGLPVDIETTITVHFRFG